MRGVLRRTEDLDVSEVREDANDEGEVTGYACAHFTTAHNDLATVVVPSYYDLVYDCSEDAAEIREVVAHRLMTRAARRFGITPEGRTCDGVGLFVDGIGLLGVSSDPKDRFEQLSCQQLVPQEKECCIVVQNKMSFIPYWPYEEVDLWAYVAAEIDSGSLTQTDESFRIAFIGSEIEATADGTELGPELSDASAVKGDIFRQPDDRDKKFTILGGFVFGVLLLSLFVVGILFLGLRRRRADRHQRMKDFATDASHVGSEPSTTLAGENILVTVLSDEPPSQPTQMVGSIDSPTTSGPWSDTDDDDHADDEMDDPDDPSSNAYNSAYRFDISDNFRNHVMSTYGECSGQYSSPSRQSSVSPSTAKSRVSSYPSTSGQTGPSCIAVVPPYPMEETSDSDVDSWAQTDGTVGSLDDPLEAVITAEI